MSFLFTFFLEAILIVRALSLADMPVVIPFFASIETIINTAKKGGMFILVDDEKRENEGDLIISTSNSNAKNINFMAKYGRGLICLALDSVQAKRLNLSLMSTNNQSRNKTAFAISIEAKKGITTGISAHDQT